MNSKYPLHPDFAHIKDQGKGSDSRLLVHIGNVLIRGMSAKIKADGVKVSEETKTIVGYKGAHIKVTIYTPCGVEGPLPCVVNYHGGAWAGDVLPHQKNYCLYIAEHTKCKVILVHYRLSLRHPFPIGLEDSYAALQWVFNNAVSLGIAPEKIAVFGDSSGGNYAAEMCILSRDRGTRMPCYQMLIYPATDASLTTESSVKYDDVPECNRYALIRAYRFYTAKGDNGTPQYVSPILADLHGLPEAYVETAEFDPLHDEGLQYAEKLRASGVKVEVNETKGSYHGFDIQLDTDYAKKALAHRAEVLRRVFAD